MKKQSTTKKQTFMNKPVNLDLSILAISKIVITSFSMIM